MPTTETQTKTSLQDTNLNYCNFFAITRIHGVDELISNLISRNGVEVNVKQKQFTVERLRPKQDPEVSHFTLTAKKCTKLYNAHAEQLLCSLNL